MSEHYYKVGQLIDGLGNLYDRRAILVKENLIESICSWEEMKHGIEVIDYSSKVILPGMMNAHVHMFSIVGLSEAEVESLTSIEKAAYAFQYAKDLLHSGITYVRNVGTEDYLDMELDEAIKKGLVEGPNIVTSGPVICMSGGHGWKEGLESDGVEECRKNTRILLKHGVGLVKVMATGGVMTKGVEPGSPQLTEEEMRVCVEEAHKADRKTATHAQGTQGIKNAIRAGIDSIEHGIFLDDEAIDMMLKNDTYLVPTLAAPYCIVVSGDESGLPDYVMRKARCVIDAHIESFKKAYTRGVKIAMGTDAGTPFNYHHNSMLELELMIEHGVTPMDAIMISTRNAADCLGVLKTHGSLEIGKHADFIIVDENPLKDIKALRDIFAVYKDGVRYK